MKTVLAAALLAIMSAPLAAAERVLNEYTWGDAARLREPGYSKLPGKIVPPHAGASFESLEVEAPGGETASWTLLVIENPGLTSRRYCIAGKARFAGVEPKAYLELESFVGEGPAYFSRNLADTGPLRYFAGDSDWREFRLPFDTLDANRHPNLLLVNIIFKGKGTVTLGPLKLLELDDTDPVVFQPAIPARPGWWNESRGGWIGGIGGGAMGTLAAVAGLLAGVGKGRKTAMAILAVTAAVGLACLASGIVAIASSQHYAVYYPLLLLGVIGTAVPAATFMAFKRRYEQLELRKMQARDA
jgi:hypothetical protein